LRADEDSGIGGLCAKKMIFLYIASTLQQGNYIDDDIRSVTNPVDERYRDVTTENVISDVEPQSLEPLATP